MLLYDHDKSGERVVGSVARMGNKIWKIFKLDCILKIKA